MNKTALQRPLRGEPIALDLVNTEWNEAGQRQDLLQADEGLAVWLAEQGIPWPASPENVRQALAAARAAIRQCLETNDGNPEALEALNAILARGRVIPVMRGTGPDEAIEVQEHWRAAWLAARGYLDLRARWPRERIRACAHPDCILYFLDATRSGTRRWCDMRTCGNRAKARRYHHRHGR